MKLKYFLTIILFSFSNIIFSQEVISFGNFDINQRPDISKSNETIEIPFIDDFSVLDSFLCHFEDNYITIEPEAAINPPTINTVMFDAIDNQGNFYATNYNSSLIADYLTSKPIDLFYHGETTVFFSFYYQPKGNLDLPEQNDSLVLQFFAPNQNKWNKVWSASSPNEGQKFRCVNINISDTSYLQKGFKFRFYNRISMPSNTFPSRVSNCDQWFVDYIILDTNRTPNDTFPYDIAFQSNIDLKFDEYQTIPYSHYLENKNAINLNCKFYLRNNKNTSLSLNSLKVIFEDKDNILEDYELLFGDHTFSSFLNDNLYFDNIDEFEFPTTNNQELKYNLRANYITDTKDFSPNNTINQYKELSVIYAYDDGTAENGYGLNEGSIYGYVAQKYFTYSTDYLTGIQVYINKTFKDVQPYYFYAYVWDSDDENAKPGTVLFAQDGFEIDFDKRNEFQTFVFPQPVEVSDTFYIGWQKTVEEMMNLGMDLSFAENNKKYYNIYGNWELSSFDGILMIRPIFGDTNLADIQDFSDNFDVYPNPADNYILITSNNQNADMIQIYDITGKNVIDIENPQKNQTIDISSLPSGIYLIKIIYEDKFYSERIIKK